MIVKTPEIESELYPTWEKLVKENPDLKNSPDIVKENYEASVEEMFAALMVLAAF
jgi:hypothetical protein